MSETREKEQKPTWSTESLTRANEIIVTIRINNITQGSMTFFDDDDVLVDQFKKAIEGMNK